MVSNDSNALKDIVAFLNTLKSKATALQEARETGLQLVGSCAGPRAARERFLEANIAPEETLPATLVDSAYQLALLVLRQCLQQDQRLLQRSRRQMTWNISVIDWIRPWLED